jgi:uridine kinase
VGYVVSVKRSALLAALADDVLGVWEPGEFCRVAVDGVDGAGKTSLADELAAELKRRGRSTVRVSVDGFHNDRVVRYRKGRDSPDGFFRDSYDYERFVSLVVRPFSSAGSGIYTPAIFDVDEERQLPPMSVQAPPGSILIADGIFLHRDELAAMWSYSIWLDVPFEVSVPRGAHRSQGSVSPDPADPANRRYVEGQRLYIQQCSPRTRATVVVDNSDLDDPFFLSRAGSP